MKFKKRNLKAGDSWGFSKFPILEAEQIDLAYFVYVCKDNANGYVVIDNARDHRTEDYHWFSSYEEAHEYAERPISCAFWNVMFGAPGRFWNLVYRIEKILA